MAAKRHYISAAVLLLIFVAMTLGSGVATGVMIKQAQDDWERPTDDIIPVIRRLFGPGSSPPTCRARCGGCYPCRAVHVAIQPGESMTLEYYPEAWRCKCGNKLYMP